MSEWEERDWESRKADERRGVRAIKWTSLQKAALDYRSSKGFVAIDWSSAANRLCCVAKEINEVEGALYRYSGCPESFVAIARNEVLLELADVTLYILTIQADLELPAGTIRESVHVPSARLASPGDVTQWLRASWSQVFDAWQRKNTKDLISALDILLAHVEALHDRLADKPDFLINSCYIKLEQMADRTPLHGGKDPRT